LKFRFHSDASTDISSSIDYYNAAAEGLGADFLNSVLACIDRVREFPESGAVYLRNYRRVFLKRFKHVVIYKVVSNELHIMAVTHVKRNPDVIRERLE